MTEIAFSPRGRTGRVGKALRAQLKTTGMDPAETGDVWAALAISTADLVDSARIARDPRLFMAASKELRSLLPLVGGLSRDVDAGAGVQSGGGGGGDDLAAELGAGPEMGDPA